MSAPAPDQAERDRIVQDLGTTLFVEAGAGSGKTSALVDRVLGLVSTGTAELRTIAAITFTEKAGAELRDRIRRALEERIQDLDGTDVGDRCRLAVDQLDGAAIGTLHAFAQRLLSENPVEAGLPPRVEVMDEVSSGTEFERRWIGFRDELLADPDLERTLLLLFGSGVKHGALRSLALAFDQNWDLVEERVPGSSPEPPALHDLLDAALEPLDAICELRDHCADHTDKLCIRLDQIADYVEALRAVDEELELLSHLTGEGHLKRPSLNVNGIGGKEKWGGMRDEVRARVREAGNGLDGMASQVTQACARRVGSALRRFTLGAASERRDDGRLAFHDLLVLSRALLCDPGQGAVVRSRLSARYDHLLLDEFQDTDPIQIELAVRIAAVNPLSPEAGKARWDEVPVTPGHLFVVGDPKQSIYRFRRADIAMFMAAADHFGPEGGGVVELSANFRTVEPIIEWLNDTFARLLAVQPQVEMHLPSQPTYVPLTATRPQPPVGPPVAVSGRDELAKGTPAAEIRMAEAGEVAATILRVVGEGWSVGDEDGGWRDARLGDITVLVPARTSLPFLEDALEKAQIPYKAESSSLVYSTRAVRDLLMVLRAADDPTDHLKVVSALRSPLLGCGDDDLFRFKVERKGQWNYLASQPESMPADDPVLAGLSYLRALHDERQWLSPAEMLSRIARERRAFEIGFAEGRPRDVWRRLRYVTDQARSWSGSAGGSLRQYLQWVDHQTAEGARVAEAVLPETDDDAVRIMTIHAAKGLEFPVTIVSGMSTEPRSNRAPAEVTFPARGGVGYRFGSRVVTDEFVENSPIDEQMGFDERIRLLYVACTRARDHLVVSLHRKAPPREGIKRTNAELLCLGMGALVDTLPDAVDELFTPRAVALAAAPSAPVPFAEWEAERRAALTTQSRPSTVAATALTEEGLADAGEELDPGLEKRPRDLDLPPWLKGRYGTSVGRAVHGVLQTIDLGSGAGLDDAIAAQCEAEAIPSRREDVWLLAQHALRSPIVRAAAALPHWREVYACTPLGGRLLEGYIDLLYRGPDGLVVVDYKTAATSDADSLARRAEGYRLQGASYALAVGRATGERVVRVTFLFLTPTGSVEVDLVDLDAAIAAVETQVADGKETVLA
ncbi:MAG: UvrD-helicase domain-containing protein [Actinomycetota bacterium]|nr:UvrD-helicase domain-containing protein [Actinomycetota bacterium]